MSVNVTMTAVPKSKFMRHMEPKPWSRALDGWGNRDIVAAAEQEAGGVAGAVTAATREWARAIGIKGYKPLGGWVTAELFSSLGKALKDAQMVRSRA